ncbi:hypothetical protein M8J75_012053 [Diaphorina citri]|nr:hypothetical protein M8J75_012053 [Diaphorina citri]
MRRTMNLIRRFGHRLNRIGHGDKRPNKKKKDEEEEKETEEEEKEEEEEKKNQLKRKNKQKRRNKDEMDNQMERRVNDSHKQLDNFSDKSGCHCHDSELGDFRLGMRTGQPAWSLDTMRTLLASGGEKEVLPV